MGYKRSMKISQTAYEDLAQDLRTLFTSAKERDPQEWTRLAYWASPEGPAGGAHSIFARLWMNADLDDTHPRFQEGTTQLLGPEGRVDTVPRPAAIRHVPFRNHGYWVRRIYREEDLTDDQIATAVRAALADILGGIPAEVSATPH